MSCIHKKENVILVYTVMSFFSLVISIKKVDKYTSHCEILQNKLLFHWYGIPVAIQIIINSAILPSLSLYRMTFKLIIFYFI